MQGKAISVCLHTVGNSCAPWPPEMPIPHQSYLLGTAMGQRSEFPGIFFPLHKKKQIIIETSDFMFKDSEGETSKARPGSNFKISLQSPLACKQHKVLGLEKIIDQPSRRFFVQFGKETFE